ncbi:hypothetical protein [Amycolatopsis alba]|uniref:Uncharacterized protein n=1 Tax=Amycolatopsis alba DSM 44262 TaxID=1125972 RepID=A0A229REE1_AMYAL|nr:hypothetical protein [Amycolatopsis alba]OXM45042.1 hypothetical protein CFP75_32535 [Amycolatopsis alba DSM 44262]
MAAWLYKLIDTGVPEVIDRIGRWFLYPVFWLTTAILALWFLQTGLVYGALVISLPLILLFRTRFHGLGRVSPALLLIAGLAAMVPNFFLGKYKEAEDGPTGLILVGFLVFLAWAAAYPAMLDKFDERFQLSRHPSDPRRKLPDDERNELALLRVLLVKIVMGTVAMLVVDATVVVILSLLALLLRSRWSAAVAGVACLIESVTVINGLDLVFKFEPLDILAGLFAASTWWDAVRNPLWDRRARVAVGR